MEEKIFQVIQCKDHIYITEKVERYYNDNIPALLFDNETAEKTYKSNWYKLKTIPKKVEKKLPNACINIRYELKAGYTPSDLMPNIIHLDTLTDSAYEQVYGLYDRKYDSVDGGYETIPFSIEVIYKKDDFEWVKTRYASNPDLISQIEFHPSLLQECPCSVDSERMYEIIRNYVKANINKMIAAITSDYDFHFQVDRKIQIAEPYSYSVDINSNNRKKPNWVKKLVDTKTATILNLKRKSSDSSYGTNCNLAPVMYGMNQVDLEDKINTYLDNLMKEINKNYSECPYCKGWGIIEEKNNA